MKFFKLCMISITMTLSSFNLFAQSGQFWHNMWWDKLDTGYSYLDDYFNNFSGSGWKGPGNDISPVFYSLITDHSNTSPATPVGSEYSVDFDLTIAHEHEFRVETGSDFHNPEGGMLSRVVPVNNSTAITADRYDVNEVYLEPFPYGAIPEVPNATCCYYSTYVHLHVPKVKETYEYLGWGDTGDIEFIFYYYIVNGVATYDRMEPTSWWL